METAMIEIRGRAGLIALALLLAGAMFIIFGCSSFESLLTETQFEDGRSETVFKTRISNGMFGKIDVEAATNQMYEWNQEGGKIIQGVDFAGQMDNTGFGAVIMAVLQAAQGQPVTPSPPAPQPSTGVTFNELPDGITIENSGADGLWLESDGDRTWIEQEDE